MCFSRLEHHRLAIVMEDSLLIEPVSKVPELSKLESLAFHHACNRVVSEADQAKLIKQSLKASKLATRRSLNVSSADISNLLVKSFTNSIMLLSQRARKTKQHRTSSSHPLRKGDVIGQLVSLRKAQLVSFLDKLLVSGLKARAASQLATRKFLSPRRGKLQRAVDLTTVKTTGIAVNFKEEFRSERATFRKQITRFQPVSSETIPHTLRFSDRFFSSEMADYRWLLSGLNGFQVEFQFNSSSQAKRRVLLSQYQLDVSKAAGLEEI